MATGTAWYNLTKPASTENYDLSTWNTNLDMIDEQMHQNETESFRGATDLANGTGGNVPAPQIADKEKFLKGDGTWGTPSGGGSSAAEMTLSDYNELTTAQKNDGTIRFIPAGSDSEASIAVDMTDITVYKESSMNITAVSSSEIDVAWNGGQEIGCNFDFNTPIDVTDYDSITFKVTNGTCYNNGAQAMYPRWDMMIGLMSVPLGQLIVLEPTDSRWVVVADMPLSNHVYEETLDVSGLTGNYYIVVCAHGWNTVIEDITLTAGGIYPSQIKYMSKTYADGTGGGSWTDLTAVLEAGETSLTITDSHITINGTYDFYTSKYGLNPLSVVIDDPSVIILLQPLVAQESELIVTATASTNWDGFEPWKAFANSAVNSGWIANGGSGGYWLQVEFPYKVKVSSIDFKSLDSNRSHAISRVSYSNDGNTFTDATLTSSTMSNNIGHADVSMSETAKYIRLCFDDILGIHTYPMVSQLELYGSIDSTSAGSMTITFEEQTEDINVKVRVS